MIKSYTLSRKSLFVSVALVCILSGIITAQGESKECPKIEIASEKGLFYPKQKVTVKAQITGNLPQTAHLIWGTSVGKVVSGHGTSQVDLFFEKADQGQNVTVFLKVEGLQSPCTSTYSETFGIATLPIGEPVERFNEQESNEVMARIDNFFIQLNGDSGYPGVIEVYFNKSDSDTKRLRALGKIFRAIKYRSYDVSKVKFLVDETPGNTEFVFWTVPPGADLPGDRDKSSLIKGEDLMKDPRKALPKRICKCQ